MIHKIITTKEQKEIEIESCQNGLYAYKRGKKIYTLQLTYKDTGVTGGWTNLSLCSSNYDGNNYFYTGKAVYKEDIIQDYIKEAMDKGETVYKFDTLKEFAHWILEGCE